MINQNKHEFALYWQALSKSVAVNAVITITDDAVVHRIVHVLRLQIGAMLILFNQERNAQVLVHAITKKQVSVEVVAVHANHMHEPEITFGLPLLRREALHEAVYGLTELGVNCIQLVHTHKVQRAWAGAHELERARNVMIAAAEQSKNFAFPELHAPITLEELAKNNRARAEHRLFFDPAGQSMSTVVAALQQEEKLHKKELLILIGPEGDLTQEEKQVLARNDFTFCALTPTVLRAQQAAIVSTGIVRSLL